MVFFRPVLHRLTASCRALPTYKNLKTLTQPASRQLIFSPASEENEVDDETLSHLRTKLYSNVVDKDKTLESLYQVGSVQEVFDIISKSTASVIFSSQALVTLWDVQKFVFYIGPIFNPRADILNKMEFLENIKRNETFQKLILRPVLEEAGELEDEALAASLLALKKMNYSLVEMEELVEECLKRKDSLCLSGLSRLSVALRSQGLYGQLVMAEFSPLIYSYVDGMGSDIEIRLASILVRNSIKSLNNHTVSRYLENIGKLLDKAEFVLEGITYCKIFLAALEIGVGALPLIHRVGKSLAKLVPKLDLMDVISLQRFLQGPLQEPYALVEALISRNLRILEEEQDRPRIDLLAAIGPFLRNTRQKQKVAQIAKDCIDNNHFINVQNVLYPLIRSLRVNDKELYDKYWNGAVDSLNDPSTDLRRVTYFAKNYFNFTHGVLFVYRHPWLESLLKNRLYHFLDKYLFNKSGSTTTERDAGNSGVFITPTEFAITFAFLLAFDPTYMDLKYLASFASFAPQLKTADLCLIAKSVDAALFSNLYNRRNFSSARFKNYEIFHQVSTSLEEEIAIRMMATDGGAAAEPFTSSDLTMSTKVISVIRKMKGDSPLLDLGVDTFLKMKSHDSREVREICSLLLGKGYLYPKAMEVIANYIGENSEIVHPEAIDKFLSLAYVLGWDGEGVDFGALARVIEVQWEQLGLGIIQCGIALGYFHQFSQDLINKIFNVDFLDHIDSELLNSYAKPNNYPLKLRIALMELNRIVCLDVPDSPLPWFHEKFCQNQIAQGTPNPSYLHLEVENLLKDVTGESTVQSNVCLSKDYYYLIDFVLKFDHSGRPIKTKQPKAFSFSRTQETNEENVKRKVAILVLPPYAFTRNVRSLKGAFKLKQRHLEMLGYKVITVDPYHWNSMYMSETFVKQNFLETKIFSSP